MEQVSRLCRTKLGRDKAVRVGLEKPSLQVS
jgi:hypothetical protein